MGYQLLNTSCFELAARREPANPQALKGLCHVMLYKVRYAIGGSSSVQPGAQRLRAQRHCRLIASMVHAGCVPCRIASPSAAAGCGSCLWCRRQWYTDSSLGRQWATVEDCKRLRACLVVVPATLAAWQYCAVLVGLRPLQQSAYACIHAYAHVVLSIASTLLLYLVQICIWFNWCLACDNL